ncbi:MAG TPA: GlsB/YeaQ/YmgE family stress response membrane protein [Terriglobia bacterium]|nr:GlsB/YeaQ/YmgE family stress response membrane protein [Terriglobia bacterium]
MQSGVVWAVLVGLISGWLAGTVMKGRGYGILMDILLGIVGGMIGRVVFGFVGLAAWGVVGSIVVSFVGSVILIWLARQLK